MYHIQAQDQTDKRKWECIDTFVTRKETREMFENYLDVYRGTGIPIRTVCNCSDCRNSERNI